VVNHQAVPAGASPVGDGVEQSRSTSIETNTTRIANWFRRHARLAPTVGTKSTRPLKFWADVLTRVVGIPCTPNLIRIALGADARVRIDDAGATNIRAKVTLTHAGFGPTAGSVATSVQAQSGVLS
jgi:hypothetical protein